MLRERMEAFRPYLIVFTASACILIIEIVAGRILAPTIGVSLYTWTSIIGIVLAGISAGNYLGGVIADRFPARSVLGLILLASGVASIAILPLEQLVSGPVLKIDIIPRIVLLTVALFLIPSVLLGMVTPVVIKQRLSNLAETGSVVGRIYAVSTVGSIFGTFLTGFVLVQFLGTRLVILIVAVVLIGMAAVFGSPWRMWKSAAVLGAAFLLVMSLVVVSGSLDSKCVEESSYYCIRVSEEERDGRIVRKLYLDALLHSYVDTEDPLHLEYQYERVFGSLAGMMAERHPDMDALFIGGGGYTMPKFMDTLFPDASLEVVEIDPAVTEVAHGYLALPRNTEIVTYWEDARTKLQTLPQGKYEYIVGDAFDDVAVPYHLTTMEFNDMVRGLLAEDGMYVINTVDKMHSGRFLRSVVHTLRQTFPFVYVLRNDSDWYSDTRYTFVVAASMSELTEQQIWDANSNSITSSHSTRIMPEDEFAKWYEGGRKTLLTDDFVPVDGMLSQLYIESR